MVHNDCDGGSCWACAQEARKTMTKDTAVREAIAGDVWSAIKSGLTMSHENMRKAVEASRYELASSFEDEIARNLADRVMVKLDDAITTKYALEVIGGLETKPHRMVQTLAFGGECFLDLGFVHPNPPSQDGGR